MAASKDRSRGQRRIPPEAVAVALLAAYSVAMFGCCLRRPTRHRQQPAQPGGLVGEITRRGWGPIIPSDVSMVASPQDEAWTLTSRRTAMAHPVLLGLNDCENGERVFDLTKRRPPCGRDGETEVIAGPIPENWIHAGALLTLDCADMEEPIRWVAGLRPSASGRCRCSP
jgi:hypothetical protein